MKGEKNLLIKGGAVVLAVFAIGILAGAAIGDMYRVRQKEQIVTPMLHDSDSYFRTLKKELSLDPDQEEAVLQILDTARQEYNSVCAEVRPRYDVVRDSARVKIREKLRPDQQHRFDSIISREGCNCSEQK